MDSNRKEEKAPVIQQASGKAEVRQARLVEEDDNNNSNMREMLTGQGCCFQAVHQTLLLLLLLLLLLVLLRNQIPLPTPSPAPAFGTVSADSQMHSAAAAASSSSPASITVKRRKPQEKGETGENYRGLYTVRTGPLLSSVHAARTP